MNDQQDTFIEEEDTSPESDIGDITANFDIRAEKADVEVKSLYDKYKKGRLNIQPDFQRQFVWDPKKASRLIESALLRVPLPAVYLSEEQDGKLSVIDGQQRLTVFFSFKDKKFPNGENFKLSGVGEKLKGKTYQELSETQQERVDECKLRTVTFLKESDVNLKFEIFQRLNSGSVSLNDQEMRNCVYRGRYNDLLRELSKDETYRKVMGFSGEDKRMRDIEYVLRFAAFFFQSYLKYKSPMKAFLNREMEQRRKITPEDEKRLRDAFKNAVNSVLTVFGPAAFRRWLIDAGSSQPEFRHESRNFSAALFDILMCEFAERDRNAITHNADIIREAMIDISTAAVNHQFIDFTTRGTSSAKAVVGRFDIWRKILDAILENETKQPRCFSRALKEEMYNAAPTCALCGNRISDIDDAAVDHIEQYWLGGKTIPENARLVHRHCNNTRPRKE